MPTEYEYNEQVFLMDAVRQYAQYHPELELLHASANGMKRDLRTGAKLKASGVKPGVPDLFLPVARGGCHGLFIEMKAIYPDGSRGSVSKEQQGWIKNLKAQGYRVRVCWGWTEALNELLEYLRGEQ